MNNLRLALLGAGSMGGALLAGLLRAGVLAPADVVATRRSGAACEQLRREFGIASTTDNVHAVKGRNVVLVAVKPAQLPGVLQEVAPHLESGALVISVAAGVTLNRLQAALPPETPVIRAMPNTPARVGEGATVFALGRHANAEHEQLAGRIFSAVGRCWSLPEALLDAATGLSGSGPAYAFIMLEALADGGVAAGLNRALALELAAQTLLGAARLVLAGAQHPAALKDSVMSPAGTTAAGCAVLERAAVRGALIDAVLAAAARAREVAT